MESTYYDEVPIEEEKSDDESYTFIDSDLEEKRKSKSKKTIEKKKVKKKDSKKD